MCKSKSISAPHYRGRHAGILAVAYPAIMINRYVRIKNTVIANFSMSTDCHMRVQYGIVTNHGTIVFSHRQRGAIYTFSQSSQLLRWKPTGRFRFRGLLASYNAISLARHSYALSTLISVHSSACSEQSHLLTKAFLQTLPFRIYNECNIWGLAKRSAHRARLLLSWQMYVWLHFRFQQFRLEHILQFVSAEELHKSICFEL